MLPQEFSEAAIDAVVRAAAAAAADWARSDAATRAGLLDALAQGLEAQREALVPLADAETSLGAVRLYGEVARTAFQLRAFAEAVRQGAPFAVQIDEAIAEPPPRGRPRLTRVQVPLGPVAMFSASNFPFAFSVLGGDTAAALAAGCPVVIKAHPGHPELSRRTHALAQDALRALGLPPGLIGMVEGATPAVGVALVRHPAIRAAAFTGSVRGGLALQAHAQQRPRPIPFFGELGSVNPVLVLPAALADAGERAAQALALAQSMGQGCGQFCTSPGLIVLTPGADAEAFVAELTRALQGLTPHAMLHAGIRAAYERATAHRAADPRLQVLTHQARGPEQTPAPFLARVAAADFIAEPALHEEVFGPAALVVEARDEAEMALVLAAVGGSLTVTFWGAEPRHQDLVRQAMDIAGRVLFKGVPTGVAVTRVQQHGGPFPSSTEPSTTSVGLAAMDRFLRPVALQDAPDWLPA